MPIHKNNISIFYYLYSINKFNIYTPSIHDLIHHLLQYWLNLYIDIPTNERTNERTTNFYYISLMN
jgi:hypothetical protein